MAQDDIDEMWESVLGLLPKFLRTHHRVAHQSPGSDSCVDQLKGSPGADLREVMACEPPNFTPVLIQLVMAESVSREGKGGKKKDS